MAHTCAEEWEGVLWGTVMWGDLRRGGFEMVRQEHERALMGISAVTRTHVLEFIFNRSCGRSLHIYKTVLLFKYLQHSGHYMYPLH
jgi:hypothetical protein